MNGRVGQVKERMGTCPLAEQLGQLSGRLVASVHRARSDGTRCPCRNDRDSSVHACEKQKGTYIVKALLEQRALLRLRHHRDSLPELVRRSVEVVCQLATNASILPKLSDWRDARSRAWAFLCPPCYGRAVVCTASSQTSRMTANGILESSA